MKKFSFFFITVVFIMGIILIIPSPKAAGPRSTSPFEKADYELALKACKSKACRAEYQTKLQILEEVTYGDK
jgi:hypothetical protein